MSSTFAYPLPIGYQNLINSLTKHMLKDVVSCLSRRKPYLALSIARTLCQPYKASPSKSNPPNPLSPPANETFA